MIELHNVTKKYPNGFEALQRVNLTLNAGEMVFLTGHSGAGKSTLLNIIAGLEPVTRGQVVVHQQNLAKLSQRKLARFRRSIGIVLQNPHLLPEQSAFDNVALPLIIAGYHREDIKNRVYGALNKVGLHHKALFYSEELSTGEQQRVGLARAVVTHPDLLLADEPTGNLDPDLSRDMLNLFSEFNRLGTSVLIATHDISLIETLSFRILHLQQGHLLEGEMHA